MDNEVGATNTENEEKLEGDMSLDDFGVNSFIQNEKHINHASLLNIHHSLNHTKGKD